VARGIIALLVAVIVILIVRLLAINVINTLTYFDVTGGGGDMGLFAEMSRLQATGGKLYVDLWDNKPPGMFFFISPFVTLLGNTTLAIGVSLVSMIVLLIVTVGAMVWQITRSRPALLAALLLAAYYGATQELLETTFLMAALTAGAVALAVAARGRPLWLVLSGMVFAYSVFTKQPAAFEFPILAAFALWRTPAGKRSKWIALSSLTGGALLVVGLVVLWAVGNGALASMWFHVGTSGVRYVTASDGGWHFRPEALEMLQYYAPFTFRYLRILLIPGAFALIVLYRDARRQPVVWITLGWVLVTFISASLARSFRSPYYTQMLPPLILLICLAIPAMQRFAALWRGVLLALFACLVPFTFPEAQGAIAWAIQDLSNEEPVVEFIEAHTQPSDCLWLWGNLSFFSYLSERPSCTSAAYDGHIMDVTAHPIEVNRLEYMAQLLQRTPALYIENSPWGQFEQLATYAERYVGQQVLFSDPYQVYEVDRSMWHPADASFGNEIRLVGYDLLPVEGPYCPGDTLTLAMTWQQMDTPTHQYQMFVQLLTSDEQGRVAAYDGPPEDDDDDNATNTWVDVGEFRLGERFDLPIEANAAPGSYKLAVGLYDVASTERVPVLDASGAQVGSYAILQPVEVSDCR
jgi:hypothetical protein